ncbi:hypothetical protein [Nocardia cyriacigeorgica]|uniref:Uncharacterized protein n=1 Tax=Nocardia cyriacigeorgica TaxID=135487 RepID=A0A5R8NEC8_9NOCA|nr:hypothetical protein [Nocardia cyriacigeorgica]TLF72887.1 hypothetical protein FEK34_28095 [Nocardia cyriacigeorgica]
MQDNTLPSFTSTTGNRFNGEQIRHRWAKNTGKLELWLGSGTTLYLRPEDAIQLGAVLVDALAEYEAIMRAEAVVG